MTTDASQVSDLNPRDPSSTLTDRVRAHVAEARQLLDSRADDSNAKHKHLRPTRMTNDASSGPSSSEALQREAQSLRTVYREMRRVYRNYRRQAGTAAVPELRSAVHAFRRSQNLTSLVQIASFLDDRQLLVW
jgi:Skp family chaperone for outer membrane proteins